MSAVADLPVVAVVGPTASGKSALGLELAQRLGGEVVNADAMQLYRGMDIGTAKLPASQRRGIAHHQLDVLDVRAEASVAAYQQAARADLAAIRERGCLPVLVGGSGLYVRAALDRLEIPPTDPDVRRYFEGELARWGTAAMHAHLTRLDPVAAERIEHRNGRRMVRALEVITLTGRPFSATMPAREFVLPTVVVGLQVPREVLDERIERRVERMWADGLPDEVRELDRQGLREGRTAGRALGYREALAHLDGELSAQEAQQQTVTATRRFARRQESWFRPDPRTTWLAHDDPQLVDRAVDAVTRAAADGPTMGRDE